MSADGLVTRDVGLARIFIGRCSRCTCITLADVAEGSQSRASDLPANRNLRCSLRYRVNRSCHAAQYHNRRDHHIYLKTIAALRPKDAAFVEHEDSRGDIEPPTIFIDRRARVQDWTVYIAARGNPGSHWGKKAYLDVRTHRPGAVVFLLEFDLVDRRKRIRVKHKIPAQG